MKYDAALKHELIRLANNYGVKTFGNNCAHPNEKKKSSVIFNDVSFSFQKDSWSAILSNRDFLARTKKLHPKSQTKGIFEMQSSNSSDALAMNVFCHPDFKKEKGVKNLFHIKEIKTIDFGYKAKVDKIIDKQIIKDKTEIDVLVNGTIFIECKLTEKDFSSKEKRIVEHYVDFKKIFNTNQLLQTPTHYNNYQLIRNILAVHQHNSEFVLLCDQRRPDLVDSFNQTVNCIKEEYFDLKNKCNIMYWQDLAKVVGNDVKIFLKEKYGIQ